MNFAKSVLKTYKMCCYINNILCKRTINLRFMFASATPEVQRKFVRKKSVLNRKKYCSYNSSNITEIEEVSRLYPFTETKSSIRSENANVLFNSSDPKTIEIQKCASVEEVFKFVRINTDHLNYQYLAQIVLALYNIQNIFLYHYEEEDNTEAKEKFFKKLLEHRELYTVTQAIDTALDSFDPLFLSYTAFYLNRLGVSAESHLVQNMALKLKDHLLNEFSLNIASRLVRTVFVENSVQPYYIVADLLPKIFGQIEQIHTTRDLEDLTICLYKLGSLLTDDVLNRYETKVDELIKKNVLTGADYQIVLKIISVFNNPTHRNKYCSRISSCILLMKNSIQSLNLMEMYHLYDIFFKNQEPGDVLNTIQRAAAKLLHEMDDIEEVNHKHKLRLFASVIYFSSPMNKEQFRQDIEKYLSGKETFSSWMTLRRIYSSLKIMDPRLWEIFWDKSCQLLKGEKDFDKIMKLMESYMFFCVDLHGFKHYAFEHHVLTVIEKLFNAKSLNTFPSRLFTAVAFALVCCYNTRLLDSLIHSFSELRTQMTPIDISKISLSLQILRQRKSLTTLTQVDQIKKVLHAATARLYAYPNLSPSICGLLVKASILRNDFDNELINEMLTSLKDSKYMSSKIMEHMCFNLYATKTLIPEILNLCTTYIIKRNTNIVGFNAEKMVNLLYHLNYQPVYEDEFFETVTDIIIRDQERLSGLGFLQAALALCFFHRIPKSFVKQIFNVEFLDKLDVELAHCYFRDRYPQRVRHTLMQLNRAVCLEYPEYNVPWFHQKYIEEYHKTNATDDVVDYFHRSVKGYLTGIVKEGSLSENIITPYGYDVNFVLHLDKNKNPTRDLDDPSGRKLALLLKNERAFTRSYVRLRGKHALKNRHLEILGYKVKLINFNEWSNLLYAKERVNFMEQLLFS